MQEVFIVSAARTPFGKFGGLLKVFSAIDLATKAVLASMKKVNLAPSLVDEVYIGVAVLAGVASVAARQILFTCGLPPTTPSLTIDRACCSSTTCIGLGWRNIGHGHINTAIVGGDGSYESNPANCPGHPLGDSLRRPNVGRPPIST